MFEFYALYTSAHFHVQFKICTVHFSLAPFFFLFPRIDPRKKKIITILTKDRENEERRRRTKHNRKRRRRCIRNARKYGEGLIVGGGGCGVGSPAINRGRSASDFKDSSWCVKTHRGFRLPLFMLLDPRSSGGPGMSTVFFPKRDSTVTINYCLDPRHG